VLLRDRHGAFCAAVTGVLLCIVVHDGGVQPLHLHLCTLPVGVEDRLVEASRALHNGADGRAPGDRVALLELLEPAGGGAGRHGRGWCLVDEWLGLGLHLQLESLWGVEGLASHGSAEGDEQEAPDEDGEEVATDDATDLVGQA
jgi:hypothetical protein